MPIAHLFPVDILASVPAEKMCKAPDGPTPSAFNFGEPTEWKERSVQKMIERKDVFSCNEFNVGCAKSAEHTIRVTDDRPFRECSRRLAPGDVEDVGKHLNDLTKAGIISVSRSPYASPNVGVHKKNGTIQMCVDYRMLNRRTVPNQYALKMR